MMPRRLLVGCSFTYRADVSTPVIFQVQPGGSGDVVVESSQWRSDPQLSVRCYTDLYGNPCTRTVLPPGTSTFVYRAVAQVPDVLDPADESAPEIGPDDLPDGTLIFTLPSRYCLPDVLGVFLLHPLLGDLIRHRHSQRPALFTLKRRSRDPVFVGPSTDLRSQPGLNLFPWICQCDRFPCHTPSPHTKFPHDFHNPWKSCPISPILFLESSRSSGRRGVVQVRRTVFRGIQE